MMTGATGFVGGRLAEELLDHGYDLRLLVRTPSDASHLKERGAEIIEGDLTDPGSIERAVRTVDGIFHIAAAYVLGGDLDWMRQVNVEGTRHVLDAARKEDVDKILYCGSDTSLGDTEGKIADETHVHDGNFRSNYARTKYEAHQMVEERIQDGDPIVHGIVSSVYGPGDESPIADLIMNHLAGHALLYLDRDAGYTFTHVDDVARALRLSYENGEVGESYLISGEPATFEEFFAALSEETSIPEPRFEVPDWLVNSVKPLVKAGASLLGKTANQIDEMIDMGRNVTRFFSNEKTKTKLDWDPRSLGEGLEDTLDWFKDKELKKSKKLLRQLRYPLLGLAGFDLVLGTTAVVFPDLYAKIIHGPNGLPAGSSLYLLARTGTLWLVFSGVQAMAAIDPIKHKTWVLAAGVLRLMDVPADPVYYLSADNLSTLGTLGLLSAPVFNFISGAVFVYAGYRGLRALRWEND
jgi:dihydroflavonol-4-reductase